MTLKELSKQHKVPLRTLSYWVESEAIAPDKVERGRRGSPNTATRVDVDAVIPLIEDYHKRLTARADELNRRAQALSTGN